jgi:cytochrome b6
MSPVAQVKNWFDERFAGDGLIEMLQHKVVPKHHLSYWYFLGGMTLFLFLIQVFTGILLLLYYRPSANEAFESVQYITTQVQFGWLIRSVHSWSANLMVFMAFAHMFSVVFLRSYRKPRELTWLSGVLLLFLSMAFGFSGYLLPWNELAFFATKVGTEVPGQIPLIGKWIMIFLRGGEEVTGATLTRFFGFHVAVLPGITTVLLALHLGLVQKFGMSMPPHVEAQWQNDPSARKEMKFFPNFLLREMMAWYVALAALATLAALFPWELGAKADPFAPAPAGIKPEWYFLAEFQMLKLLPAKIGFIDGELVGIAAFGLGGLIWMLLPFIEQGRRERQPLITGIGIFALSFIVVGTVYGYIAK